MELKNLKKSIENFNIDNKFYIFLNKSSNDFLPLQYVKAIANIKKTPINYIEDLNNISNPLFSTSTDSLNVFRTDKLENVDPSISNINNLIIICNSIDNELQPFFNLDVVEFPTLEEWQIKDYVYTRGKGIEPKYLDWIFDICNKDIYRLEKELDKLDLFEESQREFIFENFLKDNMYEDLNNFQIFDLTNAIQARDYDKISFLLQNISSMDIDPMGLFSMIYANFKKLIQVWLDKAPTPESTGLKYNQIYAIKNLPHTYNKEQLANILKFLSLIDYKIKNGSLETSNLIDYLIIKILSM